MHSSLDVHLSLQIKVHACLGLSHCTVCMAMVGILYSHSGGASKIDVYVHWVRVESKLSVLSVACSRPLAGALRVLCAVDQADGNQEHQDLQGSRQHRLR